MCAVLQGGALCVAGARLRGGEQQQEKASDMLALWLLELVVSVSVCAFLSPAMLPSFNTSPRDISQSPVKVLIPSEFCPSARPWASHVLCINVYYQPCVEITSEVK